MTEDLDFVTYMDSTDVKAVATAARRLDATAFFRNQLSHEEFQKSIGRSDEEIFAEREKYRIIEENARAARAWQTLEDLAYG